MVDNNYRPQLIPTKNVKLGYLILFFFSSWWNIRLYCGGGELYQSFPML